VEGRPGNMGRERSISPITQPALQMSTAPSYLPTERGEAVSSGREEAGKEEDLRSPSKSSGGRYQVVITCEGVKREREGGREGHCWLALAS
jgi:hypothetical protein